MSELARRDRIVLLAGSLEDYLPGPWMGRSEFSAEGPSERRKCGRCQGEGRIRTRRGIEPCVSCASKGVVEVDSYTGRVVAKVRDDEFSVSSTEIAETVRAERVDADARRRRRERVDFLLREERDGEDWADWVFRRRVALYRAGDYQALERRLAELTLTDPRAAVAFLIVYGPRAADRTAGPQMRARAEQALDWLETVMPPVPRIPTWLETPASRDDEILRLSRLRMPQTAIAQRLGVSTATVGRRLRVLTAV